MDREWREASDLRASLLNIGIVVISAAVLRGWRVQQGPLAPAESDIVAAVLQLVHTGTYRPEALAAPTLPIMFILPESVPAYLPPTSMQVLQLPGMVRSLQKLANPMASMASSGSRM